ncbi:MAG: imidazole glycerol phosphate synthase subunit HisH [Clostridia bacterium]|nr:imidazole glycerol phosphate synthase subunit HisH [Clostridia bacterium]
MLAIIDYGAGNLRSVQKACEAVGTQAQITSDPKEILSADRVILPGVGAFGDCMGSLAKSNLIDTIHQVTAQGTPFLGICLGMQLLFSASEDSPGVEGLNIFPGKIVKIPQTEGFKIPHMGWNSLNFTKESPLFHGLGDNPFVYFVHSYYMQPEDPSIIAATTEYCGTLPVALSRKNIFATQFHPEKSGDVGLTILKNFTQFGGDR